jgi:segregation and condensation protein B
MQLSSKIEAILFYKGEPVSAKKLAILLETNEQEINNAILQLKNSLSGRGITLLSKDGEYMLGTSAEVSDIIDRVAKEELSKDIGNAGLETLSIILYKGPISRSEIDYIRGVNSTFILRNLLIRGLVERIPNPKDSRSYLYKTTFDLLSFLGISDINELPDKERIISAIDKFEKREERLEQEEDGQEG